MDFKISEKSKQTVMKGIRLTILLFILTIAISCNQINSKSELPFQVQPNLFEYSKPNDLGLAVAQGTETIKVFAPNDSSNQFSNGVVMIGFKNALYCQWQSSVKDEDAPETYVAYSKSIDGKTWSIPQALHPGLENGYCSSGGWWVNGDTLVAYINTWPANIQPEGGFVQYITSTNGVDWSKPKPVSMANGDTLKGIFEQDPKSLPNGRIINAAHFQPGMIVSPIYTDNASGIRGWKRAQFKNLNDSGNISREIEPSSFLRKDGAIVMTFRDQKSSFKRLASISYDNGETWSGIKITEMPDSRSKQSCGNLENGTAFMVGNPVNNKLRIPLVITLSKDGKLFNKAFLLRKGGENIQPLRYKGKYKRPGYHYPKSMVWNEYLYVSYSTNKEDVEFTRIPLTSLNF